MGQEEERSDELVGRRRRQEERGAHEPDGEAHQRHRVGRHTRRDEPSREGERDPPLEMARHEALALLDETPQEPGFRTPHVAARRQDESARQLEGAVALRKYASKLAEQLSGAPVARRAREDARRVRALDHRGQRRIDVERLRAELRLEERPEPARLGNDVRRHDHDPARRARRVRLVGGERRGARAREQVLGAGERLVHADVREPSARRRQDDPSHQG